ncbi:hypothetical protein ACQPZP_40600 [Spirillospora sp. CA-142024]
MTLDLQHPAPHAFLPLLVDKADAVVVRATRGLRHEQPPGLRAWR